MTPFAGQIRQLGYVVRDIDAAMRYWIETMRVGPFFRIGPVDAETFRFRGQPSPVVLSIAFAQAGAMQIELIQQHNDAPSLFREFLDAGREGLQHVAFWTTDFDADMARYAETGFVPVQSAQFGGPGNRNAFFPPDDRYGPAVEISELGERKATLFRMIADAAEDWDGTDPLRSL